jgi:putative transposase
LCLHAHQEGRYKASLIEAGRYLLTCYRYIELNPVAAGMTRRPEGYPWSSYAYHGWGRPDRLISAHAHYMALAADATARQSAYRALFQERLPDVDVHRMRACLDYNHPLGHDRFREQIEAALGRSVGYSRRGRPRQCAETA